MHFVARVQNKYKEAGYLKTASHVSCLEDLALGPEVRSNSCTISGVRRSRLKRSASFWRHEGYVRFIPCLLVKLGLQWGRERLLQYISFHFFFLLARVITFLSVALSFSSPLQQTRRSWRARLIVLHSFYQWSSLLYLLRQDVDKRGCCYSYTLLHAYTTFT